MIEGFDFRAMQAQGDAAGVPELYVLTMTPLPLTADPAAVPQDPSPLEVHYAYMHRLIEQGKIVPMGPCIGEPRLPEHAPVPPGFGSLTEVFRDTAAGEG